MDTGRKLRLVKGMGADKIDISKLSKGSYFIEIVLVITQGVFFYKKIIDAK